MKKPTISSVNVCAFRYNLEVPTTTIIKIRILKAKVMFSWYVMLKTIKNITKPEIPIMCILAFIRNKTSKRHVIAEIKVAKKKPYNSAKIAFEMTLVMIKNRSSTYK